MLIWEYCKFGKKENFALYFLNRHISFDIPYKLLKFDTQIHEREPTRSIVVILVKHFQTELMAKIFFSQFSHFILHHISQVA